MRSRAVGQSLAISLLLILIAALAACPDSSRQETHDWKNVLALADAAWQRGDLLEAQSAYLRAARIASWKDDWKGILTAACGMKRIEGARGLYLNTRSVLVLAMIAAERNRSEAGMRAVANAFTTIGERDAAAMVLSKVEPPRVSPWGEILSKSPGQERGSSRRVEQGWNRSKDDSLDHSALWNCRDGGK